MRKKMAWRLFFYILGLLLLALGLTLCTKAGLGMSAMSTTPYCISLITGISFGDAMFWFYCGCVAVELVLKGRQTRLRDLLQLPLSLVFTRVMNLYDAVIPQQTGALWIRALVLLLSIVLTGLGVAMSLDAKLVPNPGDGVVQELAQFFKTGTGFMKNLVDLLCVAATVVLGYISGYHWSGIGVGTILGVLGVGRTVALFDRLCLKKLQALSGIPAD